MSITPLIKELRNSGGTLITFQSSSEDLNFLMNESDERVFAWSKFALVNLPDEDRPTAKEENFIQYDAIPGAFTEVNQTSPNKRLAESFQNYVLNLETMLINDDNYNSTLKRTVSERIFFKWLKEMGGMRFKQAEVGEKSGNVEGARFMESDVDNYQDVVKYIGDIDMVNATKNKTNSYSEVYIHVPISHGDTEKVLFKAIADDNYNEGKVYQYNPEDPSDSEYIVGRSFDDTHPSGLSTKAQYNSPTSNFNNDKYSLKKEVIDVDGTKRIVDGWFYEYAFEDSYINDVNFGDQQNDKLKINGKEEYLNKNINLLRNRLDGISIDFDTDSYYDILTNPNYKSFGDYNVGDGNNFEFNAVLLYYDVYEKANPTDKVTNLFGVLFLNAPDSISGGGSTIERYKKFVPNKATNDNGNAYGFKVNMKLDLNSNDAQVESIVNEYNTYSMELFLESMTELLRVGNNLDDVNDNFTSLHEQVDALSDYVYRVQDVDKLQTQIEEIQSVLEASHETFESNDKIIGLINQAYTDINNIYKGLTSVEVTLNLDAITDGKGINVIKRGNKAIIENTRVSYEVEANPIISISNDFQIKNNQYEYIVKNLTHSQILRVEEEGYSNFDQVEINKNISIYIDDTYNNWITGKKFRISFGSIYFTNLSESFTINIYTDATDKLKNGKPYGVKMHTQDLTDYIFKFKQVTDNKDGNIQKNIPPALEFSCVDADKFIFILDIL